MIQVKQVSMCFRMANDRIVSLKEYAIARLKGRLDYRDFWVFQDISFQVGKGEVVGIIGKNGAGKSTLLKIIAGVLTPTKGTVTLQGNVVPMLELGSGFDLELSGRENIFLNGSILGYRKEFLEEKYPEILEFSELQEFIEMPIRNYSSGMLMRLAFSIATMVKPEILIVDEILAVGDEAFQKKSKKKMLELMSGGTTVLFVSHSIEQIRELCHRVVWLENGKIMMIGEAKKVCDAYQEFMNPTVHLEDTIWERKRNTDAEKYVMDLLFVYGDLGEDYEWRVHHQKEQLLAGNMASSEIDYLDFSEDLMAKYRVFFFVGCPNTEEFKRDIKKLKQYGKTVLLDCRGAEEWKNHTIFLELKEEIDGIVAATKEVANEAKKEGFCVYWNPDVASDRMEQLSEWAVYDRDILPKLDVNQMSGDMEVVNYYRARKKQEERENGNLRIGCLDTDWENVRELLDAVCDDGQEAEIYLRPDLEPEQSRQLQDRYGGKIRYLESVEREGLPRAYADLDLVIAILRTDSRKREIFLQSIYAGLVKTPFFVWDRDSGGQNCDFYEAEKTPFSVWDRDKNGDEKGEEEEKAAFVIQAKTAREFYQEVKKQYHNRKWIKEQMERVFCRMKEERTAICTGWKLTKWIREQEKPQIVFLLRNGMEEEKKRNLLICAGWCREQGMDVLVLWDDKKGDLAEQRGSGKQNDGAFVGSGSRKFFELSRSEVYLYGSFDRVVAGTWEECEFLQSYPNIRKRIYIQQGEKREAYSSGDYRRFQRMQWYAPCVEMEVYMQREFLERDSELFGEYVEAKVISCKAEEWGREIFGIAVESKTTPDAGIKIESRKG